MEKDENINENNAPEVDQQSPSMQAEQGENLESDAERFALKQALDEAKNKAEENWNLFLRTRAEMDNVRRRADLDVENARKYGIERFARELIAVVDSLEHGVQVAESSGDAAYKEGMVLTLKLCLNIFEKFGVVRIDPAVGEPVDPLKHEVISTYADPKVEPNRIVATPQKGFMLQERVLRPARVVVSAG